MITITAIKNPLDPFSSQQILFIPDGSTIDDCVDIINPRIPTTYNLAIAYDGINIDLANPPDIPDGCCVTVIAIPQFGGGGGSGDIVKTVVMVAVAVVAAVVAPIAIPFIAESVGTVVATGIYIAAVMATNLVVSTILNAVFPASQGRVASTGSGNFIEGATLADSVASPTSAIDSSSGASQSSSTYSWSTNGNSIGEGITLPELYGEMRIVPPCISRYVSTDGNNQYLHMLFALCHWNIDHRELVESMYSIGVPEFEGVIRKLHVNDNLYENFGDIVIDYRLGFNVQDSIPEFSTLKTGVQQDRLLTHDGEWYEFDTSSTYVNSISLSFLFPYGLFNTEASKDGGTTVASSVSLYFEHAQYKEDGVYADHDYIVSSGTYIGEQEYFVGSYWSGGYFDGSKFDDGVPVWIQFADGGLNPHYSYEEYHPEQSMTLPSGVVDPYSFWLYVENGVLLYDKSALKISKYKKAVSFQSIQTSAYVSEALTSSFSRDYVMVSSSSNIGRRHIRCRRSAEEKPQYGQNDVRLQMYEETINRGLTYPNVALLAVKALATDKISGGVPTISAIVSRSGLYVWNENLYNGTTGGYGAYDTVRANNPAWICYDILHGCRAINSTVDQQWRYLQTGPIKAENIIYQDFKDWADFCDIETVFYGKTAYNSLAGDTWLFLLKDSRYPVAGDIFTINDSSVERVITDVSSATQNATITLNTTGPVGYGASYVTLSPSSHEDILIGSVVSATVFVMPYNPPYTIGTTVYAIYAIGMSYIFINSSDTIRAGETFTLDGSTVQYAVTYDRVGYGSPVYFTPALQTETYAGQSIYFGSAIASGISHEITITKDCYDGTLYFSPACTDLWLTGTQISIVVSNIDITPQISFETPLDYDVKGNTILIFKDHETMEMYPYKKKYTCNIYIDVTTNMKSCLDTIGLCGRGAVIQIGSKFSCIVERPEKYPVQRFIFNMANIENSSFSQSWLSLDDRSNVVEVKYWDEKNDYKEAIVTIEQQTINSDTEIKRTAIDLIGCTNEAMAKAFAKYLLNANRYVTLIASWYAHIDSIGCFPGQIIEVQHDVPQFGYGGRLLDGCTTSKLCLDKDVLLSPPVSPATFTEYEIIFYHQADDSREIITYKYYGTEELTTSILEHNVNYLEQKDEILVAPVSDSKYMFGELGRSNMLMRVLSITRESDFKRKITAIEFNNEVYSDDVEVHPKNPSNLAIELKPPAFEKVSATLVWYLNSAKRIFDQYIVITPTFQAGAYRNNLPIVSYKLYYHFETGNTLDTLYPSTYEGPVEQTTPEFKYESVAVTNQTLYVAETCVNTLKYESSKTKATPLYITQEYDDGEVLNIEVDNTAINTQQGYTYGDTTYTVHITWNPIGFQLVDGFYTPIEEWNGGCNYYMYSGYIIVWGFTEDASSVPSADTLQSITTNTIGDIFTTSGEKIVVPSIVDAIARNAARYQFTEKYSFNYLKIAVVGVKKLGGLSHLDTTKENYGLEWLTIRMVVPYNEQNVLNTDITDLELIITMKPGAVFLNELRFDYPLVSPDITGFALIYRKQTNWWSWPVKTEIPAYDLLGRGLSFSEIVDMEADYIDYTQWGGEAGVNDFILQYEKWQLANVGAESPELRRYPYFYMSLSYGDYYEIMKVDVDTLETTRNVEKLPSVYYETLSSDCNIIDHYITVNPTLHTYKEGDLFVVGPDADNLNYDHVFTITSQRFQTRIYFDYKVHLKWDAGFVVAIGDFTGDNSLRSWPVGTALSYMPNELTDSWQVLPDTTTRSFLFEEPVEINFALHLTLVAYKVLQESYTFEGTVGYERCHYAMWEIIEED